MATEGDQRLQRKKLGGKVIFPPSFYYPEELIMDSDVLIYSISDRYIDYLREDPKLQMVYDNDAGKRTHTRKYLGVVIPQNGMNYYIPFSTPKENDYIITPEGNRIIRKSIVPLIRMVTTDTLSGEPELKGTLTLNNMIPVPVEELDLYDLTNEPDLNYKERVHKEFVFIKKNKSLIYKNASIIYGQKTRESEYYPDPLKKPNYLNSTIDFIYAEQRCEAFCVEHGLTSIIPLRTMKTISISECKTEEMVSVKNVISKVAHK